jgi:hypothetical protein
MMQNPQYTGFIISFMGNITLYIYTQIYTQEQGNITKNTPDTIKQQRESHFASALQI